MGSGISIHGYSAGDFIVTDLKPNMEGIREVLKSPEVQAMCLQAAKTITDRCNSMLNPKLVKAGAYYSGTVVVRGYTAGALIKPGNFLAERDDRKHNTIKKACGV